MQTNLASCVRVRHEVQDCRSRRKRPLATIDAREGGIRRKWRAESWPPFAVPSPLFERALPTNTLCLARAPS